MPEMWNWSFGTIPLFRIFSVYVGLVEVGQTGLVSLFRVKQGFQLNTVQQENVVTYLAHIFLLDNSTVHFENSVTGKTDQININTTY